MENTQQLIDKLSNAVSYKFKEDGTSPGITISKLRHGYYCSVVRYPKGAPANKKKVVVCKAQADTLDEAIKGATVAFLAVAKPQLDPIQELAEAVKTSGK